MKRISSSVIAAFGIALAVTMVSSTLFTGVAGAQFYPAPFGYGDFGFPGMYGPYGAPNAFGGPYDYGYGMPYSSGMPSSYNAPTLIDQLAEQLQSMWQMQYAQPYMQPYTQPATYTQYPQQMAVPQPATSTGAAGNFLTIPGLEGLQGFMPGQNRLTLAVIPVTQQNSQLGFQVVGFAISGTSGGSATAYSLSSPLAGVIDPAQNTLQIDLSKLADAISQAGYVDASQVYSSMRSDPKVVLIDVDMAYQGVQGSQTTFTVTGVDMIPASGQMQAFSMQQPTQLILDSQAMRLYMVAFPQMVDSFTNFYGAAYPEVLPIVYAQPVPVLAPIFVPYLTPFPIFFSSFVGFNPFFFGDGFVSFFNFNTFGRHFPIHEKGFGHAEFNQFAGRGAFDRAGFTQAGGRFAQPAGVGAISQANIGTVGATAGSRLAQTAAAPFGQAKARSPGVSTISQAPAGFSQARGPGVTTTSGPGIASVRTPAVSLSSGSGVPSITSGLGKGISPQSFSAGKTPAVSGISRGVSGIGAGKGAGMGGGRVGGGRR